MQIRRLRYWQWVIIGLIAGGLLALVRGQFGIADSAEIRPGMSVKRFLALAHVQESSTTKHIFRDLMIYPPLDRKNYVSGFYLARDGRYSAFQFNAMIPFDDGAAIKSADIRECLAVRYPHVVYRFAWWGSSQAQGLLWGGGAFLLIGIVWPILLRALGGADDSISPAISLLSVPHSTEIAKPQTALTKQDNEQMEDLTKALQDSLHSAGPTDVVPVPATSASAVAPQPFSALTDATATKQSPDEPKDYRGEFYPVARDPDHKPSSE